MRDRFIRLTWIGIYMYVLCVYGVLRELDSVYVDRYLEVDGK